MDTKWQCPKCQCTEHEEDLVSTTGKGLSRFFNVQNTRFIALTCTQCKYTELYKTEATTMENIIDFIGN